MTNLEQIQFLIFIHCMCSPTLYLFFKLMKVNSWHEKICVTLQSKIELKILVIRKGVFSLCFLCMWYLWKVVRANFLSSNLTIGFITANFNHSLLNLSSFQSSHCLLFATTRPIETIPLQKIIQHHSSFFFLQVSGTNYKSSSVVCDAAVKELRFVLAARSPKSETSAGQAF